MLFPGHELCGLPTIFDLTIFTLSYNASLLTSSRMSLMRVIDRTPSLYQIWSLSVSPPKYMAHFPFQQLIGQRLWPLTLPLQKTGSRFTRVMDFLLDNFQLFVSFHSRLTKKNRCWCWSGSMNLTEIFVLLQDMDNFIVSILRPTPQLMTTVSWWMCVVSESFYLGLPLCCRPIRWGTKCWWPSSICPLVRLCVTCLTRSREGHRKLKIGRRKPMTRLTRDPVQRTTGQRSRSLGRLIPRRKMRHIFRKGDRRNSSLVQAWSMVTRISNMRGDVKGQRSR